MMNNIENIILSNDNSIDISKREIFLDNLIDSLVPFDVIRDRDGVEIFHVFNFAYNSVVL